jgi:hypothetical protein
MLVSVDDLATYMDIKFSNRQTRAASFVLAGLQSELESYLRRPVEVGSFVEDHVIPPDYASFPVSSHLYDVTLDTTGNPPGYVRPAVTVYMRNTPITSVDSIILSPSIGASVAANEGTEYIVHRYGVDLYRALPNDKVTVSYTGGLEGEAIPVFKLLILRAATREMQNMHDDVVGIKDLETRNVAPLVTGFTEQELQSVRRWRRVRIA